MNDSEQIEKLYHEMYRAMVKKDREALERVHDGSFVLSHMTGMRQSKRVYIDSIMNGTLNYFSEKTEKLTASVSGDTARLTGYSRVEAAVFGGGRHTWPLALEFTLRRDGGAWRFTSAQASTY